MKMRHSVKWMLMGALVVPHLTACSFGGEGEGEEEVEASEEGNAAEAEGENVAVEGAESNAAAEGNSAGNVAFEDANANANAEGAAASSDIPPELLNSQNDVAGAEGVGNAALGAEGTATEAMAGMGAEGNAAAMGAEGNAAAMGAEGTMPATDAAAAAPATDAVPAAPQMAAPGDARVYYVSSDGTPMHSGADASSSAVGSLSKGEPVLVKVEGSWAHVINRGYVEVAKLSQSPVGRSSAPKSWR